ncbi:hypothetical protein L3X38_036436 [Prunus dulcis]|uniref:Uncharacterized protein n=1 Tax=Prunus dulcis TaxID=3755 RepID=A0AAD4V2R7_PRUDU|nr:hypothetical protein L3X38_036436 [Prunus dulcis]
MADLEEYGLTNKEKKRKIKQATVISLVLTSCLVIKDDHVISFLKKYLIGLDLPHNDALIINIQIKISKIARSLTNLNGVTTVTMGTTMLDVYSPLVIDYTDLKKTCPKDNFPLPRMD